MSDTTATNTAQTITRRELFLGMLASGVDIVSMSTGTTSTSLVAQTGSGFIVLQAIFPAGAWVGDLTIDGKGRDNAALSETLTNPGAGGGTVKGVKAFLSIDTVTNTAPSLALTIHLQPSARLAVSVAPVVDFYKVSLAGEDVTIGITRDATNGWVDFGGFTSTDPVEIIYAESFNLVQAAHGHTVT